MKNCCFVGNCGTEKERSLMVEKELVRQTDLKGRRTDSLGASVSLHLFKPDLNWLNCEEIAE